MTDTAISFETETVISFETETNMVSHDFNRSPNQPLCLPTLPPASNACCHVQA